MKRIAVCKTPVRLLEGLSRPNTLLWVKHDDQTNPLYGGNKVRKAERLLQHAVATGAKEIVTVGAIGSNHVLTTGIFARQLGLHVAAVVVRQPRTLHVIANLRADLAQGVELLPASSYAHASLRVAARMARGAYYIPAGGSNTIGASAYVSAVEELATQVRMNEMPEPDLIVVALGSGGTTAGIVAGLAKEGLRSRVLAVTVAEPTWFVERAARSLAKRCSVKSLRRDLLARLEYDRRYIGPGYGRATERTVDAMKQAASAGLALEQTYTAKAFAAALDRVARGEERTILYWHTVSSAPMATLLVGAPDEEDIDARLKRLVV